jgi:hypothetical protein
MSSSITSIDYTTNGAGNIGWTEEWQANRRQQPLSTTFGDCVCWITKNKPNTLVLSGPGPTERHEKLPDRAAGKCCRFVQIGKNLFVFVIAKDREGGNDKWFLIGWEKGDCHIGGTIPTPLPENAFLKSVSFPDENTVHLVYTVEKGSFSVEFSG